jgi:hypothetical protein
MAFQSNAFQSNAFQLRTGAVVVITPTVAHGRLPYVQGRSRDDVRREREQLGITPKARKIIAQVAQAHAAEVSAPQVSALQQRMEREGIAWNAMYAQLLQMQHEAQRQAMLTKISMQAMLSGIEMQSRVSQEQEEQAIVLLMYQFM